MSAVSTASVISQSHFDITSPVINTNTPISNTTTHHKNSITNIEHVCIGTSVIANGVIGTTTNAPMGSGPGPMLNNPSNAKKNISRERIRKMKESSPPRIRASATLKNSFVNKETLDLRQQRARITGLPSALDNFDQIIEAAAGKRVAVFLDYDGTLSPIVQDPDQAFMPDEMRTIVKEVANVFPTAIISGRSREKIRDFVKLPELYYAGSHGMDIMGPKEATCHTAVVGAQSQELVLVQPGNEFLVPINEVFKLLEDKTKDIQGARVEHNKFCVTVHFRCVKEKNWIGLAERVQEVVKSYPQLHLTEGRKILEIRPKTTWNKGKALDYLLKTLGLGDQGNVFPIYIGDDRSDEDAFKVLNRKKHGLSVLVTTVQKETNAVCTLRDPEEVGELLIRLVKWKRRRLNKFP